jgi:hypothetical protein
MLKQSQKRVNLAAFLELFTSKTPAKYKGWFATIPMLLPPNLAKPTIIFSAILMHFKEGILINYTSNNAMHVVRLIRVIRNNSCELFPYLIV